MKKLLNANKIENTQKALVDRASERVNSITGLIKACFFSDEGAEIPSGSNP